MDTTLAITGFISLVLIIAIVFAVAIQSENLATFEEKCIKRGGFMYHPENTRGNPQPICLKAENVIRIEQ